MATLSKPILHNGFKVKENITVEGRVDRFFFTEVYLLSNKKFLYLFVNLHRDEVVERGEQYNLITVSVDDKEYVGTIIEEHSRENISILVDALTNRKGFDSVAGMNDLKQLLIAEVINPLKNPEKFKKFNVSIPNGIILHGPPGVGKSFIVRKLAEELGYNYKEVKASDLASTYIHGAVEKIRKIFDEAKQNAPTVLCFNEISALVPDRKNMNEMSSYKEEETSEFLVQLEEAADNNVLVIGTTNFLERIDDAVMRSGRLDKKIFVPLPDLEARKGLFKIALIDRPCNKNVDFSKLASLTDNFTSADIIEGVVETAARMAVNLDKPDIDQELLELEINKHKQNIL